MGNEAQDRADTGDDAVHDQAVQPACHADALEEAVQSIGILSAPFRFSKV